MSPHPFFKVALSTVEASVSGKQSEASVQSLVIGVLTHIRKDYSKLLVLESVI